MRMVSNRNDIGSGLFLLIVGMSLAIFSLRFPVWDEAGPQEGFFPFVIGLILTGLSIAIVINACRNTERAKERQTKERTDWPRALFYVGLVVLYGFLFEKIGFLITSGVFLLILLKFVERQKWSVTIIVSIFAVIVSYYLFVYFLGVPLPKGLFPKW